MNAALKWTIILTPVVIGGVATFVYVKKYYVPTKQAIPAGSAANKSTGTGTATGTPSAVATNVSSCSFPLKVGSNNSCVGQLQDILGVTIDNKFGSGTLGALQEQTGKTQITDANDLSNTIDQVMAQDAANGMLARAQALLSTYTQSQSIFTLNSTVWKQVVMDSSNSWVYVGYQLSLGASKKMNNNDYQLWDIDNATGNLLIVCNTGANAGIWSANPLDITLV
jgi:hypothetical protein